MLLSQATCWVRRLTLADRDLPTSLAVSSGAFHLGKMPYTLQMYSQLTTVPQGLKVLAAGALRMLTGYAHSGFQPQHPGTQVITT